MILAHKEARLEATHHLGHVFVERITVAHKLIDQFLKVGLTLGTLPLLRVQGVCYPSDLLDLFADPLLLRLDRVQAPVDAVGQAAQLPLCGPPFFASKLR